MTLHISTEKIKKEWTDYNGHMNVAYYVLIFDLNAAELLMNKFHMGEKSAKETNKSNFLCAIPRIAFQRPKRGPAGMSSA